MHKHALVVWAVASCCLATGCIVDGEYRITGHVAGLQDGARVPLADARVYARASRNREATGGHVGTVTRDDGAFRVLYGFGGMIPFVSDGKPVLEVRAPGYRACSARVRSDEPTPGVVRGRCTETPQCYQMEILLAPEDAALPDDAPVCR